MADLDMLDRTPLFVACTRPAMKMGVPVEGLMINAGVSYIAALWVGRMDPTRLSFWLCVFLALLVHYSMRWLTGIDHNIFRILCLFVMTRGIELRGVSVLWAVPWRRPTSSREVATSV